MMQPSLTSHSAGEDALLAAIAPLRDRLARHPLYASIRSLPALQIFMQSHVYAVWDFMSLLKALQRALTCVTVPWLPTADAADRRLINEIVLGEESDLYEGEPLSHFELYLRAMQSCDADTGPVLALTRILTDTLAADGSSDEAPAAALDQALSAAPLPAPAEAAAFVRATFAVLSTGQTHRIAAAFTFGREDLIPEMFSAFVRGLDAEFPGRIAPFRYYLERHIEVDGEDHGPMAMQMIRQVCRSEKEWAEATETACVALEARLALWDGIHARILAR